MKETMFRRVRTIFGSATAAIVAGAFASVAIPGQSAFASEVDLVLPSLDVQFNIFGSIVGGRALLMGGIVVAVLGLLFGLMEFYRIKALKAHSSMLEVSALIYETCKTYLLQQAKFLFAIWVLVSLCMVYYFAALKGLGMTRTLTIVSFSALGIIGSFGIAWFGIRMNCYANSRTAFASIQGKPYPVMNIPLTAGMSLGVVLVCVEIFLMLMTLLFAPPEAAAACFLGFAIGESLGASVLRICGGIFTKIADIGADLMKIVFNIKEDDARNPGVIADCAGDNAGDSVGPSADGFETYGVTIVALITFILLAVGKTLTAAGTTETLAGAEGMQAQLIVWVFLMGVIMIITSISSYVLNGVVSRARFGDKAKFDFEVPLTTLIWFCSIVSIVLTFAATKVLLGNLPNDLWLPMATIMSCGTLAAALIPEFTKVFTSSKSQHVAEIVNAAREGGASLCILAGLVAGNFSAFWKGMVIVGLMLVAGTTASTYLGGVMIYPSVFAFGLVAFGFLSMAPVTIAVDGFGPVSDNAQSIFELSQIEVLPGIEAEILRDFGFKPNFEEGKDFLEANDSAGNTFKATAKPVLIGTAVIGATTMIFSLILQHQLKLDLMDQRVLYGLMCGGAVVYWFTGATIQAVSTGAYRAVEFIKRNIKLESSARASVEDSKEVVRICTQYAQAGMINIFGAMFCFTLAFACFSPTFFASFLISIAVFGLFQALFMANAGGAWDNAKKVVEVELKEKGSALHAATVVGDTVGDPYKDTSSVALNPVIKFTTLFGLLAVEIAALAPATTSLSIGVVCFLTALFFVHRSFYGMRIVANATQPGTSQSSNEAKVRGPAGGAQ